MLFAQFMKKYLESNAWRAEILPDDGSGIHLVIEKDSVRVGVHLSDERTGSVGGAAVRAALAGAEAHNCARAAVIAQSSFAGSAEREAANADPPVILIDKDNIGRASHLLEKTWTEAPPPGAGGIPWKWVAIGGAVLLMGGGAALLLWPEPPPPPVEVAAVPAPTPAATATPAPPAAPAEAAATPAPPPDNTLTPLEEAEGWRLLFDGRTTAGWTDNKQKPVRLAVAGGELATQGFAEPLLFHERAWGDFTLKLDYKVGPGFDRGVCVRTFPQIPLAGGQPHDYAAEISMADGATDPYKAAGGILDFVKPTKNAAKPAGQWNHLEIACDGGTISTTLNGEPVALMNQDEWTQEHLRPDGSRHRLPVALKIRAKAGYIGLPAGKPAWFKNIKILQKKKM